MDHERLFFEAIPGFYLFFGLAAACLMILVLRPLGERLLQRRENYYKEHGE